MAQQLDQVGAAAALTQVRGVDTDLHVVTEISWLMEVRSYAPDAREGVRALLRETFGSCAVFDRVVDGNPLGEPVAVVAAHDGRVVGFNTWNPWIVHGPRGPVVAYQSGASAVSDTMRGQGIFGKLLRLGEEVARGRGVAALFGFPNPASLPGFLKVGWEQPSVLRLFVSPLPSLGVGPLGLRSPAPSKPANDAASFVAWRYARAGVTPRALRLPDGRVVTVYARRERKRGATLNKLLDVVDGAGRRVLTGLGPLAARLPGPGLTILRAGAAPGAMPPWLPV
jgi:GNAT superfamily N-acetyltransferase